MPSNYVWLAIGGARGSGKSTLARQLGSILRADIIHLGRLRSVLRGLPEVDPSLRNRVNDSESFGVSMSVLQEQAQVLRKAMKKVFEEAEKRRASLIVEGTHCLPGMYTGVELHNVDLHVVLEVSNSTLRSRYGKDKWRGGTAASQSSVVTEEIANNYEIQGGILRLAARHDGLVQIVDAEYLPAALVDIVRLLPARCIPRGGSGSD
jgi:2-phosphoglycerate kinase